MHLKTHSLYSVSSLLGQSLTSLVVDVHLRDVNYFTEVLAHAKHNPEGQYTAIKTKENTDFIKMSNWSRICPILPISSSPRCVGELSYMLSATVVDRTR